MTNELPSHEEHAGAVAHADKHPRAFGAAGWRSLTARIGRLRIKPGSRVRLGDFDPDDKLGYEKDDASTILESNVKAMEGLHELLWASCTRSLLIVLQGMDTSGKDGVIKHVLTGLNPQGCRVTSFKVPTEEEAHHDFLWRVHKVTPARGEVGIFDRSHYEGVLVERVEELTPEAIWKKRYDQINTFESLLADGGTRVVKLFLNISKKEQKERLEARQEDQTKNWKFSEHDLVTRSKWNEYMRAFEDVLSRCSTKDSPWYVVPSNRKWVRNIAASAIIRHELEAMKLEWPRPKLDVKKIKID